nr:hypothetical protein [Tanacetum cinerariifolium]
MTMIIFVGLGELMGYFGGDQVQGQRFRTRLLKIQVAQKKIQVVQKKVKIAFENADSSLRVELIPSKVNDVKVLMLLEGSYYCLKEVNTARLELKLFRDVAAAAHMNTPIPAAKPAVVAVSTPISAAKPAAKPKVLKIVAAALAVSTRKRKRVVIRDPEVELHDDTPMETLSEELDKENEESFKKINWNTAFDHVQAKDVQAKGTQYIRRYHGFKKKPQSESEAHKNMIAYLKNTKGFKMAFFKGKTYDQILPIFQARFDANLRFLFKSREEMEKEEEEIIKSINETPAQKAAKRRRLHEQAKEQFVNE